MSDDDLIRGPKWRTRTTPARRRRAAVVTFAAMAAVGLAVALVVTWVLDRLGAPWWVVTMPWWLPTAGAVLWTLRRPAPAVATDSDDDSWGGFAIRYVLVGEDEPRPTPARVVTAVLAGAVVAWALLVFGLLAAAGLFDL